MPIKAENRVTKFVDWVLYAALAYCAMSITGSIDKMKDSVTELNVKMGVVVEKINNHEVQIQKQDERIKALEKGAR